MKALKKNFPDVLFVLLFGLIVTTFYWTQFFPVEDALKSEIRELEEFPEQNLDLSLLDFPEQYSNAFSDQFPLRYWMIQWSHQVRFYVFQERFFSDVIIGEDNWLNLNETVYTDICQKVSPIKPAKIDIIAGKILDTWDALARQDIKVALAVIPEKCNIYPEYIQTYLPELGTASLPDLLVNSLSGRGNFPVIELSDTILEAKRQHQVYLERDTHWTAYGSYAAYRQIFDVISPELPGEEAVVWNWESDFELVDLRTDLGTMSAISGLQHELVTLPDVMYLPFERMASGEVVYKNPDAANALTLLVFHDSFFDSEPIKPLIAEHFQTTVFLNANNDYFWTNDLEKLSPLISEWAPDIILIAYSERNVKFLDGGLEVFEP